jgi:hypothetical protein
MSPAPKEEDKQNRKKGGDKNHADSNKNDPSKSSLCDQHPSQVHDTTKQISHAKKRSFYSEESYYTQQEKQQQEEYCDFNWWSAGGRGRKDRIMRMMKQQENKKVAVTGECSATEGIMEKNPHHISSRSIVTPPSLLLAPFRNGNLPFACSENSRRMHTPQNRDLLLLTMKHRDYSISSTYSQEQQHQQIRSQYYDQAAEHQVFLCSNITKSGMKKNVANGDAESSRSIRILKKEGAAVPPALAMLVRRNVNLSHSVGAVQEECQRQSLRTNSFSTSTSPTTAGAPPDHCNIFSEDPTSAGTSAKVNRIYSCDPAPYPRHHKNKQQGGGKLVEDAEYYGDDLRNGSSPHEDKTKIRPHSREVLVPGMPYSKGSIYPTQNDVLCGRGNAINMHVGNKLFRSMVMSIKMDYVKAPKSRKGIFPTKIISQIEELDPPGRFLKFNMSTREWSEISLKQAIAKTRQALREGAPSIAAGNNGISDQRKLPLENNKSGENKKNKEEPPPPCFVFPRSKEKLNSTKMERGNKKASNHKNNHNRDIRQKNPDDLPRRKQEAANYGKTRGDEEEEVCNLDQNRNLLSYSDHRSYKSDEWQETGGGSRLQNNASEIDKNSGVSLPLLNDVMSPSSRAAPPSSAAIISPRRGLLGAFHLQREQEEEQKEHAPMEDSRRRAQEQHQHQQNTEPPLSPPSSALDTTSTKTVREDSCHHITKATMRSERTKQMGPALTNDSGSADILLSPSRGRQQQEEEQLLSSTSNNNEERGDEPYCSSSPREQQMLAATALLHLLKSRPC